MGNASNGEYEKAHLAAVKMLGLRMYSCKELEDKLLAKGYESGNIAKLIEEFRKCAYLDDVEYAKAYIRGSYLKFKGRMRIEHELAERGVASEDIKAAFYENDEDGAIESEGAGEFVRALELARKALSQISINSDAQDKNSTYKEKKRIRDKLIRKLSTKGFDASTTYKAVETAVLEIYAKIQENDLNML